MMGIGEISQQTGLTPYILGVVYDFYGHKLLGTRPQQHDVFGAWYTPNPTSIPSMYGISNTDVKIMVSKREIELKKKCDQGLLTPDLKDQQLVHEFTGWAQTSGGHFLYTYFIGRGSLATREKEMAKAENWVVIHKDHLSLFHTRIGVKELKKYYSLNSMDIKEDGRGHLSLDIRYVVGRWFKSQENEKYKPLLRDNIDLFKKGGDYLITLYNKVDAGAEEEEEVQEMIIERNVPVLECIAQYRATIDK
jgi:hypothetical protein